MQGVTTQVYAPKISTKGTTSLKKNLDNRGPAPSLLRICVSLRHTTSALASFLTAAGHSSSATEITRPKYLKQVSISRGRPYALKALEATAPSHLPMPGTFSLASPHSHIVPCTNESHFQRELLVWEISLLQNHLGVLDIPLP